MGRPLTSKYFGNRNFGSPSTTTDDGIGGQSIASVTLDPANLGAYTTRPTTSFALPTVTNGVRAVGTVTSELNTTTAFAGGTNYTAGDTLSIGSDTVITVSTVNGGGTILTYVITARGSYPYAAGVLPTGAQSATNLVVANPLAAGATFTVNYRAQSVLLSEIGSGYVSSPAITFSQSVQGAAVLTTAATGGAFPVIKAYSYTGSTREQVDILKQVSSRRYAVVGATLAPNEPWTVRSAILVPREAAADTDGDNQYNEMDITVTDAAGKAYWVLKLTAHKAVIVRKTANVDGEFADPAVYPNGQTVAWTFNDTSGTKVLETQPYLEAGVNVKIEQV